MKKRYKLKTVTDLRILKAELRAEVTVYEQSVFSELRYFKANVTALAKRTASNVLQKFMVLSLIKFIQDRRSK